MSNLSQARHLRPLPKGKENNSMRTALAFALALSVSATAALAQDAKAPANAPAPAAATPAPAPTSKVGTTADCKNPNALGVERVVQIDTTGGPEGVRVFAEIGRAHV